MKTAKIILQTYLDEIEHKKATGGEITGISSGFVDIDRVTCGWQRENLIFLGGVPGMGTSSLLDNFAMNAIKSHPNSRVAIYSPFSSESEWINSLVSSEGKIDSTRLRRGDLGEDDMDRVLYAARMINQVGNRLFHSTGMFLTVSEILKECLELKENGGLDLLIIDGLECLKGSDRVLELKYIAKELSIPVICSTSLLSKADHRPDKRPKMCDLPMNEDIYKVSDLLMFVYRDEYYHPDSAEVGKSEIIFAKNRQGETGKTYLAWLPTFRAFHNMLEE